MLPSNPTFRFGKMRRRLRGHFKWVGSEGEKLETAQVIFLPTHSASNACGGKVFTVEMHHKRQDSANPGDNIGMNIKGLDKMNMPRTGDVMVYKKDSTLSACADFDAQIQVPGRTGEAETGS